MSSLPIAARKRVASVLGGDGRNPKRGKIDCTNDLPNRLLRQAYVHSTMGLDTLINSRRIGNRNEDRYPAETSLDVFNALPSELAFHDSRALKSYSRRKFNRRGNVMNAPTFTAFNGMKTNERPVFAGVVETPALIANGDTRDIGASTKIVATVAGTQRICNTGPSLITHGMLVAWDYPDEEGGKPTTYFGHDKPPEKFVAKIVPANMLDEYARVVRRVLAGESLASIEGVYPGVMVGEMKKALRALQDAVTRGSTDVVAEATVSVMSILQHLMRARVIGMAMGPAVPGQYFDVLIGARF